MLGASCFVLCVCECVFCIAANAAQFDVSGFRNLLRTLKEQQRAAEIASDLLSAARTAYSVFLVFAVLIHSSSTVLCALDLYGILLAT